MSKEKEDFKKSMHQDELVSFTEKVIIYFKDPANVKKWLDVLFYVVIAIVALFMVRNCQVNRDNTVKNKVGPAEFKFMEGKYAEVVPLLNDINKDYPNTKYTGQALFYLGESNYKLGKYEEAIKAFEEARKKSISALIKPRICVSLAYSYEALKENAKAAAVFEEGLKKFPNFESRDEMLSGAARNYKLCGKTEEAKAKYEEIITKYPTSALVENAKQNLGR